jgi:phosphate-selective porin OprO/OprP
MFELQDAFIQYNGLDDHGWQFKLGNFKEDFSMEYTTSSRFITFMERPMCVTAFNFTRRLGFQAQWQKLDWLRISAGVTGQEIAGWMYRHNIEESMKREIKGHGPNFTGKIVFMPWGGLPNQGLHLGYNVQTRSGRRLSEDVNLDGADSRAWYATRIDSRNATAVNRTKYFDTDWIRGIKYDFIQGFELAGYMDGFRIGSEFITFKAIMDPKHDIFKTIPDAPKTYSDNPDAFRNLYAETKNFWGYYVQATYLLFGGKYRYDVNQSEFTQPSRGRSWGDIELKVRYDFLDLNNKHKDYWVHNIAGTGQAGGEGYNWSFGAVWWANNNVRLMLNYQISHNDAFANGRGGTNPGGRRFAAVGKNEQGQWTGNPYDVVADHPIGVKFHTLQTRVEIAF